MPFSAIAGKDRTRLVMRYLIHLKSTTCGAGRQCWVVSVSVSHSKHLFLTRLSANGRKRVEPIGVGQATWWWWDSSARQSYITRPYIGIFHSSGRCGAEPGLFLVQGPCQVFGISALSQHRTAYTDHATTSTSTPGLERENININPSDPPQYNSLEHLVLERTK